MEDNIKMDLEEIGFEGVDCINFALERYNRELWKHIPLSLRCQCGNIAIIFATDNVKSVAP
jgi:hypothetical protein